MHTPRLRSLAAAAALVVAASVQAQNVVNYVGTGDSRWFAQSPGGLYVNWDLRLPGLGDLAYLGLTGNIAYDRNSTVWGVRQNHADNRLNIVGGATLAVTNLYEVLAGTTTITSGAISLGDNAVFTNRDRVEFFGATLTVTGSAFVNEESGIIKGKGTFNVSGVDFINYGTYAPGASPGWMMHGGNFAQGLNGIFDVELGGVPGSYLVDRLDVVGNATLNGWLDLEVLYGYVPIAGETHVVMTHTGGRFGEFRGLTGAEGWRIVYGAGTVGVQAVPEPASLAALGLGALALLRRRRAA